MKTVIQFTMFVSRKVPGVQKIQRVRFRSEAPGEFDEPSADQRLPWEKDDFNNYWSVDSIIAREVRYEDRNNWN
jgi:hypothetical protein